MKLKYLFLSLIANLIFSSSSYAAYSEQLDKAHALEVSAKISQTYSNITVTKKGGLSVQSDDYDLDGRNAAVFASNGAKLNIKGSSTITTTRANHSHGVFAYDNQSKGTQINLYGTTITINSNYSAGIMTGGGIISADSIKVTTSGDRSPAIWLNESGGTINISGGTFTTKGINSPALLLNSGSEITLKNATLTASKSSDVIALTNSDCIVNLSGTKLNGTISADEDSFLELNINNNSTYTGKIKTSGDVTVNVALGSTWNLTGNSYVKALENNGKIISNDYSIFVDGSTTSEDIVIHDDPTAPSITTSSLAAGFVGKGYSKTIKATGTTPIYWKLSSGTLSDGLELDSSYDEDEGEITLSGTPTTEKKYSFTILASNDYGTSTKSYTMTIKAAPVAPEITTENLKDAEVGKSYSFTLSATGTKPIVWSTDIKELPEGLDFTTTGVLKGKVTTKGSYPIIFKASNDADEIATTLTLNVKDVKPTISGTINSGAINEEYLSTFIIKGTGSINVTTSGDLPAELTFEQSKDVDDNLVDNVYVLSGTPTEIWNKRFTITATNQDDSTLTSSLTSNLVINSVAPKIITTKLASGDIEHEYSSEIEYSGTNPIITLTGLPKGITSNDTETGKITFSGTPEKSGTYTVKLTLKNDAGSVSKSYKVIIYEKPTITTTSADVTVNSNFSINLKATGTTPITWTAQNLTTDVNLNGAILKGKLSSNGSKTINITATNALGSSEIEFTLRAKYAAPTLTGTVKQGNIDIPYTASFKAKGNGNISITCAEADELQNIGLSLVEKETVEGNTVEAEITGTPTEAYNKKISVTATNEDGKSVTKTFNLVIKAVKPQITTTKLEAGNINEAYSSPLKITGTKREFSVTVTPDWLEYDPDEEVIKGTPTTYGKITAKITAANVAGTVNKSLKFEVFAPPVINASAITENEATEGKNYSKKFTATGSTPIKWALKEGSTLPEGMKLSSTGTLSGKPKFNPDKLTFDFTVVASNSVADVEYEVTNFKVNSIPPVVKTSSLKSSKTGVNYTVTLKASGTAPITWEADGLPDGLELDQDTGIISGSATETGTFSVKLTATNGNNETVSKTLNMTMAQGKTSTSNSNSKSLPEDNEKEFAIVNENAETKNKNESLSVNAENKIHKISDNYVVIAELGTISADEDGMYDFEVELNENAKAGTELLWIANPQDVEASEDDEICEFYNSKDEEIDRVPEDKIINISVWLEEGIIYEPVIAAKKK